MWPVKLNLGQIRGTGCFRILDALTVLVCHAENSNVLVVCFIVEGAVCCKSLNLAEHPTWKRTKPRINESSSLGNGPPPASCQHRGGGIPQLLLPPAQMTSLGGTFAFRDGWVIAGVRPSSTVCFFWRSRCSS